MPFSTQKEVNAMSEQAALEFEREKWRDEYDLRKRDLALKERDASRSRWSSPVVLALLAAALAGFGNAAAIWLNGRQARELEEAKAEAARILEVIRTDNPDKAATNLKFLVDAGLISDDARRASIRTFLAARGAGQGPVLPGASPWSLAWMAATTGMSPEALEKLFKELDFSDAAQAQELRELIKKRRQNNP
jgi:AraC-like DNA-binding protein